MKMPWGKFAGKMIYEVPNDYLRWLMDRANVQGIAPNDQQFYKAVEKEIMERDASGYFVPAE